MHGHRRRAAARRRPRCRYRGVLRQAVRLEMCGRVADRAVQIFGGAGYIGDYGIERFYRDVRLFRIYEGTTQIQQLLIARNMIRAAQG
ncbi:acyl-CoA dehydrogenase family protein [Pseudomonas aeruginosa]